MKIQRTRWIVRDFTLGDEFGNEVFSAIDEFQDLGYEVEIQYQHSDNVVSAFIIGRGE